MTNQELLDCIKAEMDGKEIERRGFNMCSYPYGWNPKPCLGSWDLTDYEYRIAPEPKKPEGRWVRIKIAEVGGDWKLKEPINGEDWIANLLNTPGFGGIEYQNPWNPAHTVISTSGNYLFSKSGGSRSSFVPRDLTEDMRPGIPVAAWFWREGEE